MGHSQRSSDYPRKSCISAPMAGACVFRLLLLPILGKSWLWADRDATSVASVVENRDATTKDEEYDHLLFKLVLVAQSENQRFQLRLEPHDRRQVCYELLRRQ